MSSTISMLANSPKISHMTNKDVFQLSFSQADEKKIKVLLCRFQECF